MSNETEFVNGMIVKPPRDGAPDFVIGSISIKREELIEWLEEREGDWVNVDLKEAKSGKWYAAVNDWKPQEGGGSSGSRGGAPQRQRPSAAPAGDNFADDDIPF